MLTFLRDSQVKKKAVYLCQCGAVVEAFKGNVQRGHTRSCGCARREVTAQRSRTHGHKSNGERSATYTVWVNMRSRCLNPRVKSFKDYGGRGITVCDEWASFERFLADMGERPDGCTLDRVDNSKGYSAENCRWAPRSVQANNKRSVIRYNFGGFSRTLTEWAAATGIGRLTLRHRIKVGVPLEVALTHKGFLRWKQP